MIDFKFILDFLKDRNLHLSVRVGTIVFVLTTLLIVNDWIGFTRNYQIDAKLTQLEKLKRLDPNQINNPIIQEKLKSLSKDIAQSEPIVYRLVPSFLLTRDNDYSKVLIPISADWYDLSAMSLSYIFIIICFIALVSIVWSRKPWKEIVNSLLGVFVVVLLTFGTGKVYKHLLLLVVPIFNNHLWINYTINILVQTILIYIWFLKVRNKSKATNSY